MSFTQPNCRDNQNNGQNRKSAWAVCVVHWFHGTADFEDFGQFGLSEIRLRDDEMQWGAAGRLLRFINNHLWAALGFSGRFILERELNVHDETTA